MNSKERLESHKRMYSWIKEQAKKTRCLDEDYEKNDWEILTDTYPELLTLVEDLISDMDTLEEEKESYRIVASWV